MGKPEIGNCAAISFAQAEPPQGTVNVILLQNCSQAATEGDLSGKPSTVPTRCAAEMLGTQHLAGNTGGPQRGRRVQYPRLPQAATEYMGKPLGLGDAAIGKALNPAECVKARQLTGGPSPERVRDDIARAQARAAQDEATLNEVSARLTESDRQLEEAIDRILAP